jgi:phosphoserine phosphatase
MCISIPKETTQLSADHKMILERKTAGKTHCAKGQTSALLSAAFMVFTDKLANLVHSNTTMV